MSTHVNRRIAILAALPREIAPLIRDWPVHKGSRRDGYLIAECDRAIAVCAGMGQNRVTYAFSLALARGPIHSVISVGYAGALRTGIARGTVHLPATVIDRRTGMRYACPDGDGVLITVDRALNAEEKHKMAEQWQADLVDMEAAEVARLASVHDLPFRALKVVSDEVDDLLPDLNRFVDDRGQFREAAFAGYIAVRPWRAAAVIRMGRHTAQASQAMAEELRKLIGGTE